MKPKTARRFLSRNKWKIGQHDWKPALMKDNSFTRRILRCLIAIELSKATVFSSLTPIGG